jgi:hypothetical protein
MARAMSQPAPAPSAIEVRPPEGIARGRVAAPAWVVAAAAVVLVAAVVVFFVVRRRRARASKSYESVAPQSSRR